MAKGQWVGVNGVARKVKTKYVGVSGVARQIKAGWVGVAGVARQYFNAGYTFGVRVDTASASVVSECTHSEGTTGISGKLTASIPEDTAANITWVLADSSGNPILIPSGTEIALTYNGTSSSLGATYGAWLSNAAYDYSDRPVGSISYRTDTTKNVTWKTEKDYYLNFECGLYGNHGSLSREPVTFNVTSLTVGGEQII